MKTLYEFLDEMDEGYYEPYDMTVALWKAAKIIRILITQDQYTQDLSFPSKFEKINKILNEDL
jgi:hypothetical protein